MVHLFLVAVLLIGISPCESSAEDLVRIASDAHRQARESIFTISATIKCKDEPDSRSESIWNWWETLECARWKGETRYNSAPSPVVQPQKRNEKEKPREKGTLVKSFDKVINKGKLVYLSKETFNNKQVQKGATEATATGYEAAFYSIWSRAGFVISDKPLITLADVLSDRKWTKDAVWSDEANSLLLVTCKKGDQLVEAILSARHNFLVKKLTITRGDPSKRIIRAVNEVKAFKQHEPGVFFPVGAVLKVVRVSEGVETPIDTVSSAFENVQINKAIPDAQFDVKVPVGQVTANRDDGTYFTMGRDGLPDPGVPIRKLARTVDETTTSSKLERFIPNKEKLVLLLLLALPILVYACYRIGRRPMSRLLGR